MLIWYAGQKALRQLDEVAWRAEESVLAPLSAGERELLHDLALRTLAHHNPRVPSGRGDQPPGPHC